MILDSWERTGKTVCFSNKEYICFPKQIKKHIGFTKKFDEKQDDGDHKKGRALETSQAHLCDKVLYKEPDNESTHKAFKVAKAVTQALMNGSEDD